MREIRKKAKMKNSFQKKKLWKEKKVLQIFNNKYKTECMYMEQSNKR